VDDRSIKTDALGLTLQGDGARGEPFGEEHRDGLRAACAEDRQIWPIYSMDFGPDGFDRNIDLISGHSKCRTFVLFEGEELVGMSSFLGIDEGRQVLEIGCTYYRPAVRGTGFNRRAKDMMLCRAFDCGVRRVEFRVDARNGRSQAAMTKLGAVREGLLREDRITWTGHVRDTILFSILASEWERSGGVHR
jgi:RimJ/RimL family protein N-acetyltransferase